ncbi:type VII secretion protein EccB [Mycobacterium sp. SM1]|uniref:type VII secretion protein EccB n=1 Tax=Mycobacterium sp. SM1 TaxID=2816243 RepID=UPI001BCD98D3|nr:type VII secretion protein EccB [Mycobacterium sp. SM1]MBS4728891.1 type VII secretion protein EccB [Mycobacterium sp. SM1]
MARQPPTALQVSGYRFLMRRLECALLRRDVSVVDEPLRAPAVSLITGCALAAAAAAGCALLAVIRPQPVLGDEPIVMGQNSGALYVRVGDTWHPVLNLASARLIAAADADPTPVAESELRRTKRGSLLGIPGAPQLLGPPIDEPAWTLCDTHSGASSGTTLIVGPRDGPGAPRPAEQAVLVTPDSGLSTYLLYHGRRALVNLSDRTVVQALRLESVVPHTVSWSLLNAVPEVPPIAPPRVPGAGGRGPRTLPGFPVGSVLVTARADGQEYYVVLSTGVQRIGQVAADLIRLADSQGAATIIAVAPDVIGANPIVSALPVSTFPDRASPPLTGDFSTLCVTWASTQPGHAEASLRAVGTPPIPDGQAAVTLSQADGTGPALDRVYLPPGRSAYVRSTGLSGDHPQSGTRYLITDTGTRFSIHDDDAARDLGLPVAAIPAPWPVLTALPAGPDLGRDSALTAWDTVTAAPVRRHSRPP